MSAVADESAAICVGCGDQATGMCWTDCGMSLCGAPICDDCRHVDEKYGWRHERRAPNQTEVVAKLAKWE